MPSVPDASGSRSRASSVSNSSTASSADEDPYLPDDGKTWQDADPDSDALVQGQFKDFFSDAIFPDMTSLLENCKTQHNFDLVATIRKWQLDFMDTIKLINYLRSQSSVPDIASKSVFDDDRFLKPVIEDDAILCCLDDLLDPGAFDDTPEQRLADLQAQFDAYKLEVRDVLNRTLDASGDTPAQIPAGAPNAKSDAGDDDGCFESYGTHHIHQDMLQDSARTDAYRDFIYGNKHLFADKVVLDVGCGTGILSMFCAKAGARRVIAVDQSDIAHKARSIVAANRLDATITVVKCRLEDLVLPDGLERVDIIVSEWMGYCLLFEAMLDTVLLARDKFLEPGGLLVPGHASLHLAAVQDPTYVSENYTYWRDVYGFDMSDMMDGPRDEISLHVPGPETVVATSTPETPEGSNPRTSPPPFEIINLYTTTVKDLDLKRSFELTLSADADELDAFVLWFDCHFTTTRDANPITSPDSSTIVLSTGPYAEKVTHWKCGLCLIDRTPTTLSSTDAATRNDKQASMSSVTGLKKGRVLAGKISVRKAHQIRDRRGLRVKISWELAAENHGSDDGCGARRQEWVMYQR